MEEKSKPQEATPEQLLKLMDIQLAAMRQKREQSTKGKNFGVISLVAIFIIAAFALGMLLYVLEEMKASRAPGAVPAAVE